MPTIASPERHFTPGQAQLTPTDKELPTISARPRRRFRGLSSGRYACRLRHEILIRSRFVGRLRRRRGRRSDGLARIGIRLPGNVPDAAEHGQAEQEDVRPPGQRMAGGDPGHEVRPGSGKRCCRKPTACRAQIPQHARKPIGPGRVHRPLPPAGPGLSRGQMAVGGGMSDIAILGSSSLAISSSATPSFDRRSQPPVNVALSRSCSLMFLPRVHS
jgi:hypothetical protein